MRDLDIRVKLKDTYLRKYKSDGSKVVDELPVSYGDARVDVAVINGSLHGFEIKSELDTLNRLANQVKIYSKTFDYLTIITSEKHLYEVLQNVPLWWGVIVASYKKKSEGIKLTIYRDAERNSAVDKFSVAQLLWRDETILALNSLGIKKGLTGKPKPFLWNKLTELVTTDQLSTIVRTQLKLRANWRSDQPLCENGDC